MAEDPNTTTQLTAKDLYEQGSKSCHQYSQTTMQVRMFSQQVLLGYAVAVSVFFSKVQVSSPLFKPVLTFAGAILFIFGVVLWALNQHHSKAFRAIRDNSLIILEKRYSDITGPWKAHHDVRKDQSKLSLIAWHAPFISMILIAILSMLSIYLLF